MTEFYYVLLTSDQCVELDSYAILIQLHFVWEVSLSKL